MGVTKKFIVVSDELAKRRGLERVMKLILDLHNWRTVDFSESEFAMFREDDQLQYIVAYSKNGDLVRLHLFSLRSEPVMIDTGFYGNRIPLDPESLLSMTGIGKMQY